jgi:uncharacterized membrane protein YjdF
MPYYPVLHNYIYLLRCLFHLFKVWEENCCGLLCCQSSQNIWAVTVAIYFSVLILPVDCYIRLYGHLYILFVFPLMLILSSRHVWVRLKFCLVDEWSIFMTLDCVYSWHNISINYCNNDWSCKDPWDEKQIFRSSRFNKNN